MTNARLIGGDCRDTMRALIAEGVRVHSVVTDPPYGLVSVVKRFGKEGAAPARSEGPTGVFSRASAGFMGQTWDGTGIEQDPEMWRLCWDLLHPGGHLLAFGGTRTWHRIAVAIEDAGFEFRDTIMWLYGSGFPKSHSPAVGIWKEIIACQSRGNAPLAVQVSASFRLVCDEEKGHIVVAPARILPGGEKALLMRIGAEEDSSGATVMLLSDCPTEHTNWSTELSWPSNSAENLDPRSMSTTGMSAAQTIGSRTFKYFMSQITRDITTPALTLADGRRWTAVSAIAPSSVESAKLSAIPTLTVLGPATSNPVKGSLGQGSALKPSWEPILVFRKPLIGTVAANVLAHGTGALNIDGCRVPHSGADGSWGNGRSTGSCWSPGRTNGAKEPEGKRHDSGRWPANVAHDGSPEVEDAFAAFGEKTSGAPGTRRKAHDTTAMSGRLGLLGRQEVGYADSGSASRFFYCAKASKADRGEGNTHPTVKPTDLMRYLCRLVTPPGGTVFDPFMGSGSTGKAALAEGFSFIGCEQDAKYLSIARTRVQGGGTADFATLLAERAAATRSMTEAVERLAHALGI